MKAESHTSNDAFTRQPGNRLTEKTNPTDQPTLQKTSSKINLKLSKNTQLAPSKSNLNQNSPKSSGKLKKNTSPPAVKSGGAFTQRESPSHPSYSITIQKPNVLSKNSNPAHIPKLNLTKAVSTHANEDYYAKPNLTMSYRAESRENNDSSREIVHKLGVGLESEQRPSFLAPTMATLQHMKDLKKWKDNNEKGFSFSRPKEKIAEYFPDGSQQGRTVRGSVFLHDSSRTSSTHNKSPFLRKIQEIAMSNDQKGVNSSRGTHANPTPQINIEEQEKADPVITKPVEKRRISDIMTKELAARWGHFSESESGSESSTTSDDEASSSEDRDEVMEKSKTTNTNSKVEIQPRENNSQMKETTKKEAISPTSDSKLSINFPEKRQRVIQSMSQTQSSLLSLSPEKKSEPIINQYFLHDNRRNTQKVTLSRDKSEDALKTAPKPKQRVEIIDFDKSEDMTHTHHMRKTDIFANKSVNFFQFNEENKLFSTYSDIRERDTTAHNFHKTQKSQETPIIVELNSTDRIIQPTYMKARGSMCITEFWSKKSNDLFTRELGNKTQRVTVKKPERENETIYRPYQWKRQEELKGRPIAGQQDLSSSPQSRSTVRKHDKTKSYFNAKSGSQSPRKDYESNKKSSPESEYALTDRHRDSRSYGISLKQSHLEPNGSQVEEKTKLSRKASESSDKERVELIPLSPNKKLTESSVAVGKVDGVVYMRYLQNGFIVRHNEAREVKKRTIRLNRLRAREELD